MNLQLKIIKGETKLINIADRICNESLNILGNKNYKVLKQNLNCNDEELSEAIKLIKSLNPKPGLVFQRIKPQDFIKPDTKVQMLNNNWEVSLVEDNFSKLKINDNYKEIIDKEEGIKKYE